MEFVSSVEEIDRLDNALEQLRLREIALRQQLVDLDYERGALLIVRGLAAASLAPIHRVPDEILGLVFLAATQGAENDTDYDNFASVALLVSHRWHNVAMSTPAVWKRISLAGISLRTLELRLERSGTLGIDIYAEWTAYDSAGFFASALERLLLHLHRWTSLSLRFMGLTPFRDFLDVSRRCRGTAPNLHSLSIVMDRYASHVAKSYTPVTLALITPNLHHVELNSVEVDFRSLSSARSFVLPNVRPTTPWDQLASIRYLRLTSDADPGLTAALTVRPSLPALESLTIMKSALGGVLFISMPALRSLKVEQGPGFLSPEWEYTLREYPILPSMHTFTFGSNSPIPAPFALHVLRLMPNLVSLCFEGSCPNDDFYYRLATSSISPDPICPRLQNFAIRRALRDPSDAVDLFIKTRSGQPGSLTAPIRGWLLDMDPRARVSAEDASDSEVDDTESDDSE